MTDTSRRSSRSSRPSLDAESNLLLMQLRNRTSKNLQASIERTDYYRQLLAALDAILHAVGAR